jgi:hypothetical protein
LQCRSGGGSTVDGADGECAIAVFEAQYGREVVGDFLEWRTCGRRFEARAAVKRLPEIFKAYEMAGE